MINDWKHKVDHDHKCHQDIAFKFILNILIHTIGSKYHHSWNTTRKDEKNWFIKTYNWIGSQQFKINSRFVQEITKLRIAFFTQ